MSSLLDASGLTFAYTDTPVLRDVALSLLPGEVVALLGPNGSGKTTLIRVLLGHLHVQGEICWDGRELNDWRRRDLARLVAYLPQSPTFDPAQRVIDVLRLGRAPYWQAFGIESSQDAEVVMRIAGMLELSDLLNRPMDRLSGGQRQRVFVGRCLVQQPKALLLDEPNTFLDLKHQIELCTLLRRLAAEQQITVLMASHDLNLAAAYANRLLLLSDGRIVRQGAADEVLQPELLSRVYGAALRRMETEDSHRPIIYSERPLPRQVP